MKTWILPLTASLGKLAGLLGCDCTCSSSCSRKFGSEVDEGFGSEGCLRRGRSNCPLEWQTPLACLMKSPAACSSSMMKNS